MKCFLTVHHVVQIAKHWKKQIKTVLQPLMYFVNAFKCTKSICQHKSFISSAVFSNSSFTISLLHHWEYTESTRKFDFADMLYWVLLYNSHILCSCIICPWDQSGIPENTPMVGCKAFLHSHNFPTRAPVCCLCQQSFQEVNGNTIYLCQSTQQLWCR